MNLAELEYQSKAYISKVNGDEDFKARIGEMGFVKGEEIKVVKVAPFNGPIEYEILGYKISLRKEEAALVDVIKDNNPLPAVDFSAFVPENLTVAPNNSDKKELRIAFVGNPNSGKTSLFNTISRSKEKVGNYGGVTIEQKTTTTTYKNTVLQLTDLPGTYSITAFTPEEKFVYDFLRKDKPDLVVNVIDAGNLERNLFLTSQLQDMGCRVIIALNMYDELLTEGKKLNFPLLSQMLHCPIIPTIATKNVGVSDLLQACIKESKASLILNKASHPDYSKDIEELISLAQKNFKSSGKALNRFEAIKLLEKLPKTEIPKEDIIGQELANKVRLIEEKESNSFGQIIVTERYNYIKRLIGRINIERPVKKQERSEKIDKILLNKVWGMPIFLAFMFITFWTTYNLGQFPQHWIELGFSALGSFISGILPQGIFHDLVVDGVISGIGGILVFLPNIIILFLFISFMEDSGYMARVSFIMDNFMQKIGLQGKAFIPLIVGFGCNVPAIMATRTIREKKDRYITMLMIPFMSCSARLPVYILLVGAFFPKNPAIVIFSLYIAGIIISVLLAKFVNLALFRKKLSLFVMELPPYRLPSVKNVSSNMWFKSSQYLRKIGKVILILSVIVWALSYFPLQKNENGNTQPAQLENSYLGDMGKAIAPVLKPLGFDWKLSISLLSGMIAKEVIVSSLNIIYHGENGQLNEKLIQESGITQTSALSLLAFILIYLPCVSVITTLYKEGGWKISAASVVLNSVLAWVLAFGIHQFGYLLF